jgi:hypothetical protein
VQPRLADGAVHGTGLFPRGSGWSFGFGGGDSGEGPRHNVVFRFLYWALTDPAAIRRGAGKDVLKAIEIVTALYDRRIRGEDVAATEWLEASNVASREWMRRVKPGRMDTLSGKAADYAALVEYSRAVGMSAEAMVEREGWAVGSILGRYPHTVKRSQTWMQRLHKRAADALIEIIISKRIKSAG